MRASEGGYVPALTGLRGVAAWWVVLYHFSEPLVDVLPIWMLALIKHGYLAVDLFFVLSGCVIYITSGQSLGRAGRLVISRFLLNRLIRIYPLHLVVMIIYLLNPLALWMFSFAGVGEGRYDWDYYVASILLVQNWGWFYYLQWNIPAWSISTEFAAYILCPLLIYAGVFRLKEKLWGLVLLIFVLAVAVGLVFKISGEYSIGGAIPTIGLVRCVLEFWIGLCLGSICRNIAAVSNGRLLLHSVIIMFSIIIFVMLLKCGINDYWLAPAFFVLLIYMLSAGDVLFSKILSIESIHYLGLISYSTYLVHYFVKDWVRFLSESVGLMQFFVYIVLCLLASAVLYRCVEEPARRVLRRRLMEVA